MLSLVVDDDEAIRSYIRSILQAENFETLEAEDGGQALEMVRRLEGGLDLIISDIQMRGMDGVTLAKAVRASYPFVPVILVSGSAEPHPDFDFVEKPFSWGFMASAIRRAVAGGNLGSAA